MRFLWFILIFVSAFAVIALWYDQARGQSLDRGFEWNTTMEACEQKSVLAARLKQAGAKPIFLGYTHNAFVMIFTLPDGSWLQIAAPEADILCVAFSGGEWTNQ